MAPWDEISPDLCREVVMKWIQKDAVFFFPGSFHIPWISSCIILYHIPINVYNNIYIYTYVYNMYIIYTYIYIYVYILWHSLQWISHDFPYIFSKVTSSPAIWGMHPAGRRARRSRWVHYSTGPGRSSWVRTLLEIQKLIVKNKGIFHGILKGFHGIL